MEYGGDVIGLLLIMREFLLWRASLLLFSGLLWAVPTLKPGIVNRFFGKKTKSTGILHDDTTAAP